MGVENGQAQKDVTRVLHEEKEQDIRLTKIFSGMQHPEESLSPIWHESNDLAALCDLGSNYSPNCNNCETDLSAKISRDARALDKSISKDKFHTKMIKNLLNMMAEKLNKKGQAYSLVDTTYEYRKVQLDELTKAL